MTVKKKLHQILSSLWKNDDDVGKIYYNQALQDVQTAIDLFPEEPVSEDMEEAAKQCAERKSYLSLRKGELVETYNLSAKESFIEGANWQKEQMMKDAVPCKIEYKDKWHINLITDDKIMEEYTERMAFKCRDKGKLIIIKEDW